MKEKGRIDWMEDPMTTRVDRRRNGRRYEDIPKPLYMSRTVLSAWVGMLASVAALTGDVYLSCDEQSSIVDGLIPLITLFSSFGSFLFHMISKRRVG